MSSNAGPGRWCLPRSLAMWGVFVLCLHVLGCKDSKPPSCSSPVVRPIRQQLAELDELIEELLTYVRLRERVLSG
jgi:hypothetical protein